MRRIITADTYVTEQTTYSLLHLCMNIKRSRKMTATKRKRNGPTTVFNTMVLKIRSFVLSLNVKLKSKKVF